MFCKQYSDKTQTLPSYTKHIKGNLNYGGGNDMGLLIGVMAVATVIVTGKLTYQR
jgi:hypothetical protein